MENTLKAKLTRHIGGQRALENCEKLHGIKVKTCERIIKMTNIEWGGSATHRRLENATVHKQWRLEISGRTFGIKEMLKKEFGMEWNPHEKIWFLPMPNGIFISTIARRIRKELSK